MDLSNAFGTIIHDLLIGRLHAYDFTKTNKKLFI